MSQHTLQSFRHMRGPYGTMDVVAMSSTALQLVLTGEFVELTRTDAEELIRTITRWLAEPRDAVVVNTHGSSSEVYVVDDGAGSPRVTIVDGDPPPPVRGPVRQRHFSPEPADDGTPPPRRPI